MTERAEPYRGTRFDLLREESTDQSQEEFLDLKSEIVDNENKIKVTKMHRMPKKESQMIRKAASRKDTCQENDKNSEGASMTQIVRKQPCPMIGLVTDEDAEHFRDRADDIRQACMEERGGLHRGSCQHPRLCHDRPLLCSTSTNR